MMLSFNTAKRPSKAITKRAFNFIAGNNNEEEHRSTSIREYITEFDPTKTLTSSTKTLIIPPLQNQFLVSKRMKDLELPIQPNSNGNNDSANTQVDEREGILKDRLLGKRMRLREELRRLDDDPCFKDMPVGEFAEAYLRVYGWSESGGVGKKRKVVEIWVSGNRTFCDKGTGFKPKGTAKPEEPKPKSSRSKKSVGERRDVRGKEVGSNRSNCKEDDKRISNGRAKNKGHEHDGKPGWLISHIRVRVISKDLKGGRLYMKKGAVVDVVGPTSCDLLMDESGELIQGVGQELLETVLPKRGGPLYVLSGRHKGVYGTLVERDLDQETGVVGDASTHELFKVKLGQIAEYIGDPSLVGY